MTRVLLAKPSRREYHETTEITRRPTMPRRRIGIAVGLIGAGFLVFYLVVRLVLMVELDTAVEQANVHNIGEILANLSPAVVVWLLWVYSFRVGMLLVIIAGGLYSGMGPGGLSLLGA